jgi:two-component system, cell cycle sensor histidine kinase and response regulator CckA
MTQLSSAPSEGAPSQFFVSGGRETILLVDDDPGVRVLFGIILRRSGYDVLEADSGSSALALFELHGSRIALLISDVVMPHLGGPALAAKIKNRNPDLPVIFITGYTNPAGIVEGDVVMQKPFSPATLAAKVKEILQ